jgi:uncharacterized protein with NRDE domain
LCTVVVLRRSGHRWPLLLAANRDELMDRPARPPARHWPDRPHVVAGLDLEAGGSWLGLNDDGLLAAVLNRRGTLGREAGKRSRGELVLDALDHAEARLAAVAFTALDPAAWRPFNLIIADAVEAFWLRHAGDGPIRATPLPEGLSTLDAGELDDPASLRLGRIRRLFEAASTPDPDAGDWRAWQELLADRTSPTDDARDALCIVTDGAYRTRSSSLVALPRWSHERPIWLHAEGLPGEAPFERVEYP